MDSDKEDGWPCPMCTYRNASYRRRCEMCNSRPSGQSPTDQVSEDIDDAEEKPLNGNKWSYTGITYPNPSGSSRRKFVNEPNKYTDKSFTFPGMDRKLREIDLDSVREPIDVANKDTPNRNDWSCSVCTLLNPAVRWKCGVCGKGRKATIKPSIFQDSDQTMGENDSDSVTEIDDVAGKVSPDGNDWICTSCTLANTAGSMRCRACHKRRKPTDEPAAFQDMDQRKMNFRLESELAKEIRIVLIGKTGSGKSATGNTILGKDAFQSVSSFSSVTQKCSSGINNRFEQELLVVDTPGLFDTGMTNEIVTKEIVKCIGMTSPGPHAIVLVVAIGRFTKEDQDTVQQFSNIFGEGMFNHMIVLFTRRDDLERQNETIQSCVQNAAPAFKEIIRKCHQRYLAFANNQVQAMREKDAMTLIQMIHDITQSNGGKCYSNEMYEEAEKQYRRRVKEIEQQKHREKEIEKEQIKQMVGYEYRQKMDKANKDKQRILEECREKERKLRSYELELQQSKEALAHSKRHERRQMEERERKLREKERALKEEETKRQQIQKERDQERQRQRRWELDEKERVVREKEHLLKMQEQIQQKETEQRKRQQAEDQERQRRLAEERKIKEEERIRREKEEERIRRDEEEELRRLQKEKEESEELLRQAEERERQSEAERRCREKELLEEAERKHQSDLCNMRSKVRKEYEEEHKGVIPSLWGGIKGVAKSVGRGICGIGKAVAGIFF